MMGRPVTMTAVLIAAVFLCVYAAFGALLLPMAMRYDFACFYLGASLFRDGHRGDLYDPQVQLPRWREIVPGKRPLVPYVRPPFYALPQSVIALLPLKQSIVVATACSVFLLFVCLWWIGKRFGEGGLILGALFLPTALGIASGQDCVILLTLMLLSYWLFEGGRMELCGAALGLGLFKFHLFLLIGPALICARRWRILAGFGCAAIAEVLLSFLLVGTQGFRGYINLFLHRNTGNWLDSAADAMPNMQAILLNFHLFHLWTLGAGIGVVVMLCGIAAWKSPWWMAWTAALLGSILIIPHVFGYDFTLVLPGLLLCVKESTSKLTRMTAVWLCTPLPYGANMADTPWPAVLPLSALLLLAGLAHEALTSGRRRD